jgi:phosphoglycolate phosphatase-like HAD superfamily hydrolase
MIKNIIWDFDGVILDSMPVRDYGFRKIFEKYDSEFVDKLLVYHAKNGGLSRYVKIRYFYEELLNQTITEDEVNIIAERFSIIMKNELTNKKYLINDSVEFIKENYKKYNFHIASGSDEKELRYLCEELEINQYFLSINGSPIHKNDLVKIILSKNNYLENETILIGDSTNDYEAAKINNIDFYGYNNVDLKDVSKTYIIDFENIKFFDYGRGEISHAKENKSFYSFKDRKEIDYLVFFDSRGLTTDEDNWKETVLMKIIDELKKQQKTFVVISRPKNTTIFQTLLNFLENNNLKFNNLLSNLGFVDFTPKKYDVVQDMLSQIENKKFITTIKSESYKLSSGKHTELYEMIYSDDYIKYIKKYIEDNFKKIFLVNTPLVDKNIKIERIRPNSFFKNLNKTNDFIDILCEEKNIEKVNISNILFEKKEALKFTNDAVHYTQIGHQKISKIIRENIFG